MLPVKLITRLAAQTPACSPIQITAKCIRCSGSVSTTHSNSIPAFTSLTCSSSAPRTTRFIVKQPEPSPPLLLLHLNLYCLPLPPLMITCSSNLLHWLSLISRPKQAYLPSRKCSFIPLLEHTNP